MSEQRKSIIVYVIVALTVLAGIGVLIVSASSNASSQTAPSTSAALPPSTVPPPPTSAPPVTDPPVTDPPVTAPPVIEPPVTQPPPPPVTAPPVTAPPEPEIATPTGVAGVDYWDRMANCETGGNWQHFPYGTWTGGLGIYNQTWLGWGGGEFAPTAGQASKDQQIIVAERIAADVGYSAWGCVSVVGYP